MPIGVGVAVGSGVLVAVGIGVLVAVGIGVLVAVGTGVGVGVATGVGVAVGTDVGVAVTLGAGVGAIALKPIDAFEATYWVVPAKLAVSVPMPAVPGVRLQEAMPFELVVPWQVLLPSAKLTV